MIAVANQQAKAMPIIWMKAIPGEVERTAKWFRLQAWVNFPAYRFRHQSRQRHLRRLDRELCGHNHPVIEGLVSSIISDNTIVHIYLVHSIHVQRSRVQTVHGLSVYVLRAAAAGRNTISRAIVNVVPISRSIDSAAHHFPLNGVPSHHIILWISSSHICFVIGGSHAIGHFQIGLPCFDDSSILTIGCWEYRAGHSWRWLPQFLLPLRGWR